MIIIPRIGRVVHMINSSINQYVEDVSFSVKKIKLIPVSPEITTYVVDIGSVHMRMHIIISELHI